MSIVGHQRLPEVLEHATDAARGHLVSTPGDERVSRRTSCRVVSAGCGVRYLRGHGRQFQSGTGL